MSLLLALMTAKWDVSPFLETFFHALGVCRNTVYWAIRELVTDMMEWAGVLRFAIRGVDLMNTAARTLSIASDMEYD